MDDFVRHEHDWRALSSLDFRSSVITCDVAEDAMAVERGQQTNREGGATRYRESRGARQQVKRRPKLSTQRF
jgi:hypothetical protein